MTSKLLFAILFTFAVSFSEDFTPWTKSADVYINTTQDGANVTGTVTNFPILVRLDSTIFNFAEAKAEGADIRFSKSDANTTPLPFEIESWDALAGKAAIWVTVDTIKGDTVQPIKMYWGNPAATSLSQPSIVFDTANGFTGVWHLSDSASDSLNKDATFNQNHGTKMPKPEDLLVGETPLGTGMIYNDDECIKNWTVTKDDNIDLSNKSMTISGWIKRLSLDNNGADYFIAMRTENTRAGLCFGYDTLSRFTFNFFGGADADLYTEPYDSLEWRFWTGTFNNETKTISIYCNGELDTSKTLATGYNETGLGDTLSFGWSGHYGLVDEWWHPRGSIDEVRVSSVVRSPEWITLEYLNQKSNQKFVSNPVPVGGVQEFGVSSTSVNATEGDPPIVIIGKAKCSLRYEWVQMNGTTELPVPFSGTKLELKTRVSGTKNTIYRFKALYLTGWQTQDVTVTITEAIPEPIFTLSIIDTSSREIDTLFIDTTNPNPAIVIAASDIKNRSEIQACPDSIINFEWNISGSDNERYYLTNYTKDSLIVYFVSQGRYPANGPYIITLCIDNGGEIQCDRDTVIVVPAGTSIRPRSIVSGNKNQIELTQFGKRIQMRLKNKNNYSFDLFAVSGKKVLTRKVKGKERYGFTLPGAGVYMLLVQNGKYRTLYRLFSY